MTPTTRPQVNVSNVCRAFGQGINRVVAVDHACLEFVGGDFVCLEGSSGSGKSTLLNIIAGLDKPDSGDVLINGESLSGMSEDIRARLRLQSVGVVFQDDNLIRELTALENVVLPLLALGNSLEQARSLARDGLERVGVAAVASRRPDFMSGGQRQRVGIARGLVGGRNILVADEPTGALDSVNSRELFSLLRTLCDEGAAVIVATHDPLVREFATLQMVVVDGQVKEA